eukprot:g19649.t1
MVKWWLSSSFSISTKLQMADRQMTERRGGYTDVICITQGPKKSCAAVRLQRVTDRVKAQQAEAKKQAFSALPEATRLRLSELYGQFFVDASDEIAALVRCLVELGIGGLFISETVRQRKFVESFHRRNAVTLD